MKNPAAKISVCY